VKLISEIHSVHVNLKNPRPRTVRTELMSEQNIPSRRHLFFVRSFGIRRDGVLSTRTQEPFSTGRRRRAFTNPTGTSTPSLAEWRRVQHCRGPVARNDFTTRPHDEVFVSVFNGSLINDVPRNLSTYTTRVRDSSIHPSSSVHCIRFFKCVYLFFVFFCSGGCCANQNHRTQIYRNARRFSFSSIPRWGETRNPIFMIRSSGRLPCWKS